MATNDPNSPQRPDDPEPSDGKALILSGIAWTGGYRVLATLAQFGAMLVLVRIIPPADYGRVGAIVGLLTFASALGCAVFINQAIQLREGIEPDWSLHWHAAVWIQTLLFIVTNVVAAALWWSADYRTIAPLLHLASIGLMLEAANALRSAMLRRSMSFRRMRILDGIAKLLSIVVMLGFGVAGYGAYAIVLGANVVPGLPGAIDLLFVKRWRPEGWLAIPRWADYRDAIVFGLQQSWSALLQAARGAAEAIVFPARLGFTSLALLQRAQALFGSTVGQVSNMVSETVYPLMPQRSGDRERYGRITTLYLQLVAMIVIVGATFAAWQGKSLLRLLYGQKWIAADPLIVPMVMVGGGLALFRSIYGVIIAKNELTRCFILDVVGAALTVTMLTTIVFGGGAEIYAWSLAAGQLVGVAIAAVMASRHLENGWFRKIFLPPLASALIAVGVTHLTTSHLDAPAIVLFLVRAVTFTSIAALVVRLLFPETLSIAMKGMPGGQRIGRWLRLSPELATER